MEQFGKYTLIRKIGTGGMAEVFLARTTMAQGLQKIVVVKKIHSAYARSKQFVTMFYDEAKMGLGLNHPNIIQTFDYGTVGDSYFLAMEWVEGMDLLKLLQEAAKQRHRIPYGISTYVVQQICKGLDYAHRKTDESGQPLGIVHRDISPQNILLSWEGSTKIVDFGIARARTVQEEEGVIKGKFAYMSPEQARGEPVDCRSDVFATGIVLFEMVCQRPLFSGKGKEALEMVKTGAIPRPRDFAPELPETLERTMLKALAFHRGDRFQTARDFQHELGRFQLEWAQKVGALVDSGTLAAHLAQLMPDQRVAMPRPVMEGADAVRDSVPESGSEPLVVSSPVPVSVVAESSDKAPSSSPALRKQARPPTPEPAAEEKPRDTRERKYVYVLQGILRGLAALEKKLGATGAARLVAEFFKVARDVAFKHDAILDLPRAVASSEASAEPEAPSQPGTMAGETSLRLVVGLPVAPSFFSSAARPRRMPCST
jgi:eukaryotic-like serine/threonine-protein kinase